MPFNIELKTVEDVVVKLQVVNNAINVLFNHPNYEKTFNLHMQLSRIMYFLPGDFFCNMVRGSDKPHVKRHHGHMGETTILHSHYLLPQNVELQEFEIFIDNILQHQGSLQLIFIEERDREYIVNAFANYLLHYAGSDVEKQYLAERALTDAEQKEIADEVAVLKSKGELSICPQDLKIADDYNDIREIKEKPLETNNSKANPSDLSESVLLAVKGIFAAKLPKVEEIEPTQISFINLKINL